MTFLKKIIVYILTIESRLILKKYKPFIVAVTGSVGKTSTKDAIYSVLKNGGGYIRKSEKSMNSEIGLPLTIIGVPNAWHSASGWWRNISAGISLLIERAKYPDCLILEVGADHPGDIKKVAKWLKPNIVVITKISKTPVHVEFFDSPEQVFEEKASLADAVRKGGSLIVFGDDANATALRERTNDKEISFITYGLESTNDLKGLNEHILYNESRSPVGLSFLVESEGLGGLVNAKGIVGSVYMYPLLAAASVGKAKNISGDKILQALNEYEAPRGRLNLIEGINNSTIIDDTYNSSPDATASALSILREIESKGGKIAVLGDMMELGKYSSEEHRKIGLMASKIVKQLVTIGPRAKTGIADEAIKSGMNPNTVQSFATSIEAMPVVALMVKPGDIILVKGSQSVRTEHIVKAIMKDQSMAGELLVRQEKEWLDKV